MLIESAIKKLDFALEEAKKLRDFILVCNNSNGSGKVDIRYKLSSSILDKLIVLTEKMLSDGGEFVRDVSSLRYTLEALINVRLFEKDEKYMLATYYSLINKQIELMEKRIERLKYEIDLYEELSKKEKSLTKSVLSNIDSNTNPSEITEQIKNVENLIDNELYFEITIFSENIETNGYSFHKFHLEEKVLPFYEKHINHLKKLRDKQANELLSMPLFKKHFPDIKNTNNVFEAIRKKCMEKSWSKKANKVSLNREYEYIYKYTSAIIHCDSYSFVTNSDFDDNERSLIIKMQSQYLEKINESIRKFLSLPDYISQFEIIKIQ
jgi:hypothetical protein